MYYFLGDIPGDVVATPASVADRFGLTDAAATLTDPSGTVRILTGSTFDGDTVTVTLPRFDVAGVHVLNITLSGVGRTAAVAPVRIPVEGPADGWHTLDSARADWQGAPPDDAVFYDLLEVAKTQCIAYAPTLDEGSPAPTHYRAAQLLQARGVWNAMRTDPGATTYGPDGYAIPVYPLDWPVKQMLRPQNPRPVVA